MSDFVFSSDQKPQGELTLLIQAIYHSDPPEVREFHGAWGSLGVSRNLYNGFQPLETEQHIFVVIGGPVLFFRDNCFLTQTDPIAGTKAIYERCLKGEMQWDEDLSGPFALLSVDKETKNVTYVTDLMSFIPIYRYKPSDKLMLGTHVDALAKAAGQTKELDRTSIVDFILNNVVTYPHTFYKNIMQTPAATLTIEGANSVLKAEAYWLPKETNSFETINEAAIDLRNGLQGYIDRITVNMKEVAQFISGGEDSRALMGLMPNHVKKDAFIFLDNMNREGKIAQKAANAYGANFHAQLRSPIHYLQILEEASDLIGSGHQYIHAHSLGFHKSCELTKYPAVFGGYLSDSLLKALYTRKLRVYGKLPFLPDFFLSGETRTKPIKNPLFPEIILSEIDDRRSAHMQRVRQLRSLTAHEWFVLWPSTMRIAIPNIFTNRRLFRSYEAFLSKDVVKISAAVPTKWKLNRRLFNKAMRPYLKPTSWLFHTDGRLPYFPWWFNSPIQFPIWICLQIAERTKILPNQGSWCDWKQIVKTDNWGMFLSKNRQGFSEFRKIANKNDRPMEYFLRGGTLTAVQKVNLLQVMNFVNLSPKRVTEIC